MGTTSAPPVSHTSANPHLTDVPLEHLEAELCTWSANLAAAEYRWFALLAEFDRRLGWQQWECHSCVAWMAWQLGRDAIHRTQEAPRRPCPRRLITDRGTDATRPSVVLQRARDHSHDRACQPSEPGRHRARWHRRPSRTGRRRLPTIPATRRRRQAATTSHDARSTISTIAVTAARTRSTTCSWCAPTTATASTKAAGKLIGCRTVRWSSRSPTAESCPQAP